MNTKTFLRVLNDNKIILMIVILVILLSFLSPTFRTYENMVNVIFQIAVEGLIAIGMTILILEQTFDLSVGSNLAFAATVAIILQKYGPVVTILGTLLASSFAGYLNGIMVSRLRINSFITTLAMMYFLRGVVYYLVKGESVMGATDYYLAVITLRFVMIPYPAIVFLILIIIVGILLSKTKIGRHIYAIGGNPMAANFLGINEKNYRTFSFLFTGLLCGIAGLITMARVNIASGRLGTYTNLNVITAVLLGGTLLSGGYGNLFKTFQGVLVLGIIANGMTLLNVQPYLQQVIKGLILILIVSIDAYFGAKRR
ncbi:MAG: ABC transporter permease [Actinobacteria bacterium]|nr:ABC transporter permease [Actinomycetota bacterium]